MEAAERFWTCFRNMMKPGESPMVATQTYVLLREREHIRIECVVLLYPGNDQPIRNGVRLVKELFADRKLGEIRGSDAVPVEEVPIAGVQDVDSREACERFGRALGSTIAQLQERYPDRPIHVSPSGGRKVMAALTYFGAQQAGLHESGTRRCWTTSLVSRRQARHPACSCRPMPQNATSSPSFRCRSSR